MHLHIGWKSSPDEFSARGPIFHAKIAPFHEKSLHLTNLKTNKVHMYRDDYDRGYGRERSEEDIYSKPVKAGKRTYFFDVKSTKGNKDYYITITESRRKVERDGRFTYEKSKIFLYKEDFDKFAEGLQDAVDYLRKNFLKDESEEISPEE